MPRIPPRAGVCLAGAGVLLGGWLAPVAPTAAAQLPSSIQVSASATELSWPDRRALTYRVDLEADEEGAEFGLLTRSPLRRLEPTLVGDGSMTPDPFLLPRSIRYGECTRGGAGEMVRHWIELPANGEAQLTLPARLAAPPWPGTDHTMRVAFYTTRLAGGQMIPVASLPLSVIGAHGVRLTIRRARRQPGRPWLRGESPALLGATHPAAPRRRVRLRAVPIRPGTISLASWRAAGSRSLGAVRTDAAGRFRVAPKRLLAEGLRGHRRAWRHGYRVLARIDNPGPGLVADWNCGPRLRPRAPRRP